MCLKYSTVHFVIYCIVLCNFSFMFVLEWWHPSNSFLGFYRQGELYQQTFTPCEKTLMMSLLPLRQVMSLRYLINELETTVDPGRLRKVVAQRLPVSGHRCKTPKFSQSKPCNENLSLTTTIHKRPWTLFGQTVWTSCKRLLDTSWYGLFVRCMYYTAQSIRTTSSDDKELHVYVINGVCMQ